MTGYILPALCVIGILILIGVAKGIASMLMTVLLMAISTEHLVYCAIALGKLNLAVVHQHPLLVTVLSLAVGGLIGYLITKKLPKGTRLVIVIGTVALVFYISTAHLGSSAMDVVTRTVRLVEWAKQSYK